ncbi:hypothetical protein [Halomonas mongoliensis]|uniref:hypothetical protein n=1 Tax=Halomonas mongoliensis TaxID=321265 RepID=UPI00403B28A5
MLKRVFRKKPVQCWVVKQVDQRLLHLCTLGRPDSRLKPEPLKEVLRQKRFSGGVIMGESGLVLNARLFDALVPEEDLELTHDGLANWRGRYWMVSTVPQKCWTWEGNLVAESNLLGSQPPMVSREDVSALSLRADRAPGLGKAVFRSQDALEDPNKDIRHAIERAMQSRAEFSQRYQEANEALWKPEKSEQES